MHPSRFAKHLMFFAIFWAVIAGVLESGLAQLPARLGLAFLHDLPLVLACTIVSQVATWGWARVLGYLQSGWWVYALYLKKEQKVVVGLFYLRYSAKDDRHAIPSATCYPCRTLGARVDVSFDNPRGTWDADLVDFHGNVATIVYKFRRDERRSMSHDEQSDVPERYLGVMLLRSRRDSKGKRTDDYDGDAKYIHESADHEGYVVCRRGRWKSRFEAAAALKEGLAALLAHEVSPTCQGRDSQGRTTAPADTPTPSVSPSNTRRPPGTLGTEVQS